MKITRLFSLRPALLRSLLFGALLCSLVTFPALADETAETQPEEATKIEIRNALVHGSLLLGGQPTPEHLAEAAQAGYRTILYTRGLDEIDWDEKAEVEKLGMRWIALPIANAGELTQENALRFAEIVGDEQLHPMMVHCGSGNRVGALFALASYYRGERSAAEALEWGLSLGLTSLTPAVQEKLGLPVDR